MTSASILEWPKFQSDVSVPVCADEEPVTSGVVPMVCCLNRVAGNWEQKKSKTTEKEQNGAWQEKLKKAVAVKVRHKENNQHGKLNI